MPGKTKTQQFLAYILKLCKHSSVHNLMKLSYLIDYFSWEKNKEQISSFHYKLYSFGPFDETIFICLENLIARGIIKSHINYTATHLEYITYAFNDMVKDLTFKNEVMPNITLNEFYLMQETLYELFHYHEHELTAMVYKTKPMKALRATPGGLAALGTKLDFSLNTTSKSALESHFSA